MELRWKRIRHFLRDPFRIAHGEFTFRDGYLLAIEDSGLVGHGECIIVPYYIADPGAIETAFRNAAKYLSGISAADPRIIWEELSDITDGQKFALSALDCALWDLYGKASNQRVVDILFPGEKDREVPITSYTIGGGSIAEMKKKIRHTPWPLYKIKLGMANELQILMELREITVAPFVVDANAGLDPDRASALLPELNSLHVRVLEQPFSPERDEDMSALKIENRPLLIADESFQKIEDLERCADYFDGINIKLMKAGGISPAVKILNKARELGLKVMIGCMTESSVGISADAVLATAADICDLDGSLLLREDIADSVTIDHGRIFLPQEAGLGIKLHGGII